MKVEDLKVGAIVGNAHRSLTNFRVDDLVVTVGYHAIYKVNDWRAELSVLTRGHSVDLSTYRDGQIIVIENRGRVSCGTGSYLSVLCAYHWGGGVMAHISINATEADLKVTPHHTSRADVNFVFNTIPETINFLQSIYPVKPLKPVEELKRGDVIGRVEDGFKDFWFDGFSTVVLHNILKPITFDPAEYPMSEGDIVVTASNKMFYPENLYQVAARYVWRRHVGTLTIQVSESASRRFESETFVNLSAFIDTDRVTSFLMDIPVPAGEKP